MKEWWKSKTVWVNVLGLVGCFAVTGGLVSDGQWSSISTQIILLANLMLRFDTTTPIGKP